MSEYTDILTDLKRKIYKPVYFFHGEEPYFIDKLTHFIEENVLDESEKEFNQTVLYGRDVDLATIIGAAKRFPMMSEYQVVIVKEAQNLKELNRSADDGDAQEESSKSVSKTTAKGNALTHYLEQPQTSTILVFAFKYKTLDKRSAIYKALQKSAVIFESKTLYESKIPDWINSYLKEKNYKISPKASAILTDFLGTDLSKISNEIDKLLISIPEGTEITPEHIQENIGISKDFNVFELQDALAKKDILKANRIVNYFAANPKDNPLVLTLGALYSYFTKILNYHFINDKSKMNVARVLGVNPYFVDGYQNAARNYSTAKLKSIFAALREYDLKSKGIEGSLASEGDLLKELIYRILH